MYNQKILKMIAETPHYCTIGPFMTTSHRLSPIYIDTRKISSNPKILTYIAKETIKLAKKLKIQYDIVIGGATAGISYATALSILSGKPMGYVRKEPKDGGLGLAVEGNWQPGMKVLLVDDAAAHGAGKSIFVKNIRDCGMTVENVIVISSRNVKSESDRAWTKESKVNLYEMSDIEAIVDYALKHQIITKEAHTLLQWYKDDPANWNNDPQKWAFFEQYKKMEKHDSISGV